MIKAVILGASYVARTRVLGLGCGCRIRVSGSFAEEFHLESLQHQIESDLMPSARCDQSDSYVARDWNELGVTNCGNETKLLSGSVIEVDCPRHYMW
ncbi:uncharacterized protein LOC132799207 isoform X11 [Ziziphus jujuba]|uniref:Uncharacterized protein LOC132799207 isoform X11 n=1 Tax=Ziziphus jujuba TaxID=326968 RepID=A0ABM3ZT92_ZIZJJ|nr:uncharacterized protein LOC132799207 isoform X11 [Ziziphus jujuba]